MRIINQFSGKAQELHEKQPNAVYIVAGSIVAALLALVLLIKCRSAASTDQKKNAKKAK